MGMKITEAMLAREKLEAAQEGHSVGIEIMPALGANLCSFAVDGWELIYWSDEDLMKDGDMRGCFHMFPTPCRLPDAKYTFQGKTYVQTKRGEPVIIHGLLRDEEMEVKREETVLTCSVKVTEQHPVYEGYPFPCIFSVEYKLLERGLQISLSYENTGGSDAPFGYGLHPFWRIEGERNDVAIRVPCNYTMELANLVPTGEISPVDGTKLDFRETTSLEGVDVDNLFWGRDVATQALVEYRAEGKKVTLDASDAFNHMIVYAPAGKPFVCVEHLTCAPNQINLYRGPGDDVSGLIIVPPEGKVEGWVRYVVASL